MKKLTNSTTNIPNQFILDGTLRRLRGIEHFVYDCILLKTDDTGLAYIPKEELKKLTGITSGSLLYSKIDKLISYGLIKKFNIKNVGLFPKNLNKNITVFEVVGKVK